MRLSQSWRVMHTCMDTSQEELAYTKHSTHNPNNCWSVSAVPVRYWQVPALLLVLRAHGRMGGGRQAYHGVLLAELVMDAFPLRNPWKSMQRELALHHAMVEAEGWNHRMEESACRKTHLQRELSPPSD